MPRVHNKNWNQILIRKCSAGLVAIDTKPSPTKDPPKFFGLSDGLVDYLAEKSRYIDIFWQQMWKNLLTPQFLGPSTGPVDYLAEKLRYMDIFDNKCDKFLERGHTTCFLAWVIFSLLLLENLTIFLSVFVHSMIKYCSNKSKSRLLGYLKGFAIKVVYLHKIYYFDRKSKSWDYCNSQ